MRIKIDDVEVEYIKKGVGSQKILLLHGWGCNIDTFAHITNFLSEFMEVYVIDFPGFGKSSEPKEAWNVDKYTDLVEKFIDQMGIEKLSLLGHSFGGRVILKLANRKNLKFEIDKLILIDSAGIKHETKKTWKQRIYKIVFPMIKKISPKLLNKIKTKVGSADYRNATPLMRDVLVKVVNEDLSNLVPTIQNPTLIIWGENDTATPYSDAEYLNKNIKDSGIVKIENAGHFSFLDAPYLVNKVLESFLKN